MGVLFIIISYLVGSIPFGVLVAKYSGLGDITKQGSGNIGATNVLRVGGKKLGAITLGLDMAKGAIMILLARYFFGENTAVLSGFAAILGHIYPVFLKFKGGKGVATAMAVIMFTSWKAGIVVALTWLIVFKYKRISSLSSIIAMMVAVPAAIIFGPHLFSITQIIVSALIIYKHKENIERLKKGEEKAFK